MKNLCHLKRGLAVWHNLSTPKNSVIPSEVFGARYGFALRGFLRNESLFAFAPGKNRFCKLYSRANHCCVLTTEDSFTATAYSGRSSDPFGITSLDR